MGFEGPRISGLRNGVLPDVSVKKQYKHPAPAALLMEGLPGRGL